MLNHNNRRWILFLFLVVFTVSFFFSSIADINVILSNHIQKENQISTLWWLLACPQISCSNKIKHLNRICLNMNND